MSDLLYLLAHAIVAFAQALPLKLVARIGRLGGGIAWHLDARHRRVALRNLTLCFGNEKSPREIRALARENFRRIGENFACAIKTAAMDLESLRPYVEFIAPALTNPSASPSPLSPTAPSLQHSNPPSLQSPNPPSLQSSITPFPVRSVVAAIGHFGNFELYARFGQFAPAYQCATTYRGLRQASLDRLLQSLRARSGCRFFERRFDAAALKSFMNEPSVILGLLSDQHAGDHGLRLPFLGHDCSTSAAPAIFALRYNCDLLTGICYRVGLAKWRIEAGVEIPTHQNGQPRPTRDIMLDINRALEAAVRRDPANWFWVHNRWKPAKLKQLPNPYC